MKILERVIPTLPTMATPWPRLLCGGAFFLCARGQIRLAAPDCKSGLERVCWFESSLAHDGHVIQLEEIAGLSPVQCEFESHGAHLAAYPKWKRTAFQKRIVVGSSPTAATYALVGQLEESPVLETGCSEFESQQGHKRRVVNIGVQAVLKTVAGRKVEGSIPLLSAWKVDRVVRCRFAKPRPR